MKHGILFPKHINRFCQIVWNAQIENIFKDSKFQHCFRKFKIIIHLQSSVISWIFRSRRSVYLIRVYTIRYAQLYLNFIIYTQLLTRNILTISCVYSLYKKLRTLKYWHFIFLSFSVLFARTTIYKQWWYSISMIEGAQYIKNPLGGGRDLTSAPTKVIWNAYNQSSKLKLFVLTLNINF